MTELSNESILILAVLGLCLFFLFILMITNAVQRRKLLRSIRNLRDEIDKTAETHGLLLPCLPAALMPILCKI